MGLVLSDIRYALRGFARTPLFTLVAVLSLAFGIGANTAVFSLVDQVLLRLLPVAHPEELVLLHAKGSHYGSNYGLNAMSYPMYRDFRDHNQVFSGMFCRYPIAASIGYGGRTERADAELVSGTYFPVLGTKAALGRLLDAHDDQPGHASNVTVLSHAFWQSRFGGDRQVLGRELVVNGHNLTVVGVAEEGFDGVELGSPSRLFIPVELTPQMLPGLGEFDNALQDRRVRWINTFGRLLPGVTAQQARASLEPYFHSMLTMEAQEAAFRNADAESKQAFLRETLEVLPGSQGRSYVRPTLEAPLWILMALTGAVLLLACANLANLMLARASARNREMAIRLSVGAGRFQIVRMLLTESLLLSFFGAALGLLMAYYADRFLLGLYLAGDTIGLQISPEPDGRVLLFTGAVLLVTTLLAGLAPALQAGRSKLAMTLKEEAGSVVGGGNVWLRKTLVIAQISLSVLLLIGAGLFLQTLANLRQVGPGFATQHLIAFSTNPMLNGYSIPRAKEFYRRLTEALEALPGVQHAGLAEVRILSGDDWDSGMTVEGYKGKTQQVFMNKISPGYFATLGVPVVSGRDFTLRDTTEVMHGTHPNNWTPDKAIVNEKFVRKYFGGRNPVGLHIGNGDDVGTKTDMEIIGVVRDIKYTNVRVETPEQVFTPYLAERQFRGLTAFIRTAQDPKTLLPAIREQVRRLDANLPVYEVRTLDEQLDISLRSERLVASLSSVFGALAALLAVIGLYGLMAYTVARRKREIGIRLALGADARKVLWMVMGEVLLLIGIGVGLALPAALLLGGLVRNQVYGVAPQDPVVMLGAALLLGIAALLAGFIPAWRASRTAPTQALRYE